MRGQGKVHTPACRLELPLFRVVRGPHARIPKPDRERGHVKLFASEKPTDDDDVKLQLPYEEGDAGEWEAGNGQENGRNCDEADQPMDCHGDEKVCVASHTDSGRDVPRGVPRDRKRFARAIR